MRTMNTLSTLAALAVIAVSLVACQKSSNSSDTSATTPVAASTCTRWSDGSMRDQYGRNCGNYATNANSCVGAAYNQATGQYYNTTTGQPMSCQSSGYFDGYNSVPYQGYYGNQQFQGCQGWTQVVYQRYGQYAQYVPVDLGNGQLICMNAAYLQQQVPQYNWAQYAQYQQPVYTCLGADCYGYGGGGGYGYGGYYGQQGCGVAVNFGFNFGYGSAGVGLCM